MLETSAAARTLTWVLLAVDIIAIVVDNTTALPRPDMFGTSMDRIMHGFTAFAHGRR